MVFSFLGTPHIRERRISVRQGFWDLCLLGTLHFLKRRTSGSPWERRISVRQGFWDLCLLGTPHFSAAWFFLFWEHRQTTGL